MESKQRLRELGGLTAGGFNRIKFCLISAREFTPVEHLKEPWWGEKGKLVPKCWGVNPDTCEICGKARRAVAEWRALLPNVPNQAERRNSRVVEVYRVRAQRH